MMLRCEVAMLGAEGVVEFLVGRMHFAGTARRETEGGGRRERCAAPRGSQGCVHSRDRSVAGPASPRTAATAFWGYQGQGLAELVIGSLGFATSLRDGHV